MRQHWIKAAFVLSLASLAWAAHGQATSASEQEDKYIWLEDVWGRKSIDWVKSHNQRSEKELHGDPRFAKYHSDALAVAASKDKLPTPDFANGQIYNTWQDARHIRGLYRRTSLQDYLNPNPRWKTVLDVDALAKQDHKDWVMERSVSLFPGDKRVLVGLSDGGEDAISLREFDLPSGKFVKGGFDLPRAKHEVTWFDRDTLLVSTDWGKDSLTTSGYPYIIKILERGQKLAQAKEIYRGATTDVDASATTLHDSLGHCVTLITRDLTFFESEFYLWRGGKARRLAFPKKTNVMGLVDNQLILLLLEDWHSGKVQAIPQGAIVSLDMKDVEHDGGHLKPQVLFAPTATEFSQNVAVTRHNVIFTTLNNVQGSAYVARLSQGAWRTKQLPIPKNLDVSITSTDSSSDNFFLTLAGFTTPTSLYLGDAATGTLKLAKARKPLFDASDLVVEQWWATSKDSTKVPYFVVHRRNLPMNGEHPTLLNAYGGFNSSSTPAYSGMLGKLWLANGGVFVMANIRGGAEFGPAWHDAGLKTHRQRIYDDFAAVAQDMFARKLTSPRRLGILGESNGGLLVGVAMTQHPEMWNAVAIGVPLLDMLRFEKIAAGSSWIGEYGSVANPDERTFLASISPYNQLKPTVDYPEPLIFTTTKDDRVGPVHARKFAARMEEFGKSFYYYEILEGGHSSGADIKQQAETEATIYIYLTRKLMGS